jgi:hypothetical protein
VKRSGSVGHRCHDSFLGDLVSLEIRDGLALPEHKDPIRAF